MPFQGDEFLINSTTDGNQSQPTQTVLGNGDILVAWLSEENLDVPNEIRARILNPDGTVKAADFILNTAPAEQNQVTTTTLPNGDALVTWSSSTLTIGEDTIHARVVDAAGHLGPEFVLNSGDSEVGVSAATLADGEVMVLSSVLLDPIAGGSEIAGHLIGADGKPTGSEFTIDRPGDQFDPEVTALLDGNAFVTWEEGTFGHAATFGEILNPDGSAAAADFQINKMPGNGMTPTALSNGSVLMTWNDGNEIHGQIVDPHSAASGSDFLISAPGTEPTGVSVTALSDGRAVAVWEEQHASSSDGTSFDGVFARVINADGTMTNPEFVVNSATDRSEGTPHVTELPNGEIFVTWTSTGEFLEEDVHGRLLTLDHTVQGTPGNDVLHGTTGSDEIFGDAGNDNLTAGAGDDVLSGGTGHNLLWGNHGNDTFLGGSGTDVFAGAAGIDTVSYTQSDAGVTVNLAKDLASGGDAAGDSLNSIESLSGSVHNDMLTGNAAGNHLDGGTGDDQISGGDGNDTLLGGQGADVLSGGKGVDTADYNGSLSAVTVSLSLGTGSGGDAQGDKLSSIENVTGSAFNDHITGDAGANLLSGGSGNDTLEGGAGNDHLIGGDSNFFASDTLIGGTGADVLTGGQGIDIFAFKSVQDSLPGHEDQITDFSNLELDKIDLSGIDANTQAHGDQAFGYIGSAAFSDVAGQLRYGDHLLQGDVNGDGTADFQVHVNVASLERGDFVL
jgi:Ca2+-binding RTX toxin-like protein